ncbi:hypothetical protein JNUCC83_09230 [Vagococcus sp. JNUCC 83]
MRQLFMLKEDYTNENTREIITRNGDKVYSINCFDDNGLSCYSVCNNKREEVVRVERHIGTTLPCLDVIVDDKVSFTVEQSPSISSMTFNITSDDLEVFDDWWSMDFDVMSGYRKVSKVRNRWTALGDAYEMTVFEKANEAQTVGLMLALDSMKKMEASVNTLK